LSTCPKEMAMRLKERRLETLTELGDVAETYVEAHATDNCLWSGSKDTTDTGPWLVPQMQSIAQ